MDHGRKAEEAGGVEEDLKEEGNLLCQAESMYLYSGDILIGAFGELLWLI